MVSASYMNFMEIIIIPAFAVALAIAAYTVVNGIGPTPTNKKVIQQLSCLLPEKVDGSIVEAGAGWGRIAVYLARQYPANHVLAVENCPPVWLFCWIRAKLSGTSNLTVKLGSIYREKLDKAGLIYCYLYPGAMKKLAPQLQSMASGSLVISNTFSLPEHKLDKVSQANDLWKSQLYRYRLSQ